MASIKLVLRKKENKDGTFPIALRITKDRKSSFIHLHNVKLSEWDTQKNCIKKSHPNSARLNNFLLKKLSEITDNALELESSKAHVSSAAVRQKAKPKAGATFFAQADLYIENLKKDGKFNRYVADKSRVKRFKEFVKHDLAFQDVTIPLLERFKASVRATTSERTAVNHLVMVRCVFSQAIKDGVCDSKYYPFGKGKIKVKFPDSKKIGLNKEEIKRLEEVELSEESHEHARNVWLLSYYFAGVRISDVLRLRWSDFQDGRLSYIMGKNAKGDSLKIPDKAAQILTKQQVFKSNQNDLVFQDLKKVKDWNNAFEIQREISTRTNFINKMLKGFVAPAAGISKTLTMHIARHSFAQNAEDIIPIQMLQKLYRHSNINTTIGYQSNFMHKDVDNALDHVLNS